MEVNTPLKNNMTIAGKYSLKLSRKYIDSFMVGCFSIVMLVFGGVYLFTIGKVNPQKQS